MELFQYAFFQYALLGSLFTAIACGIVGTYIVSRRLVFISGGITHASFGGLGLGFYTGMNPTVCYSGCFWGRMGQQDSANTGRFCHSGRLVVRYGFGCDLYLSDTWLCS